MLRCLAEGFAGYGEGAQHVLTAHGGRPEVRGGLGDQLVVPEAWTGALEVLCGEIVDAVVVDGAATAASLCRRTARGSPGPGHLPLPIPATRPRRRRPAGRRHQRPVRWSRVPRPSCRTCAASWPAPSSATADDAALAGAHAARGAEYPLVFLSPTGLLVTSDGLVRGGARRARRGEPARPRRQGRQARRRGRRPRAQGHRRRDHAGDQPGRPRVCPHPAEPGPRGPDRTSTPTCKAPRSPSRSSRTAARPPCAAATS